ncbi:hypothetical protein pb186bvf_017309 [Paramecium bursaria]
MQIQKVSSTTSPYSEIQFSKQRQSEYQQEKSIGEYSYILSNQIGVGQFSKVFLGKNKNGEQVAIKVIDKKRIQKDNIFERLFQNELKIMFKLHFKSILKLYRVEETQNNLYLITEYCKDGDLYSQIQNVKQIPERNAIRILKHLIKALLYLKQLKIIHRDIKPQNILLSDQVPKLADFGFAVVGDIIEQQFQIGTPLYMSPETFYNCKYNDKTDLFSLGLVYYEMIIGTLPFNAANKQELDKMYQKYKKDQYIYFPEYISNESKDLIKNMLAYDPQQRYSIELVANHKLILEVEIYDQTLIDNEPKVQFFLCFTPVYDFITNTTSLFLIIQFFNGVNFCNGTFLRESLICIGVDQLLGDVREFQTSVFILSKWLTVRV